jgi:hypothetical protein
MQHDRPDFPTMEQVGEANHEQLARWYRFLIFRRYQRTAEDHGQDCGAILGGMTPAGRKRSVSEPNFCYRLATTLRIFWISGLQQTLCL